MLLWALGLWELITHTSLEPTVFDRYSPAYVGLLVVYTLAGIPLAYLIARPGSLGELALRTLSYIQARGWLAVSLMMASMLIFSAPAVNWERFYKHPALQLIAIFLIFVFNGLILFHGWRQRREKPLWRTVVLALLALLLAAEVLLQLLSFVGALPRGFRSELGLFYPYGRIYNGDVGLAVTNRYGRYAAAVDGGEVERRILVIGDEFVYASDQPKAIHFTTQLEERLDAEAPTDVVAVAAAGYGPQHYYEAVKVAIDQFDVDEVWFVLNPRDDFYNVMWQLDPREPQQTPFFVLEESGFWNLHDSSILSQHLNFHTLVDSDRPLYTNLVRTTQSHLLLPQLVRYVVSGAPIPPWFGGTVDEPADVAGGELQSLGKKRFIYQTDPATNALAAMQLTENLLEISARLVERTGASFKVVTVPTMPEEFYAASAGSDWQTTFDRFDLLEPERQLIEFAAEKNVTLLPTATLLQSMNTDSAELQSWFQPDGMTFTPEGHAAFTDILVDNLVNR